MRLRRPFGPFIPRGALMSPDLPRIIVHPLCLFGHVPECHWLRIPGEQWTTFIYLCRRCNRVTGNSHAAPSEYPVN